MADDPRSMLLESRLYLLATTALCRRPLLRTVRLAIEGGVDIVQLREKEMGDGELLSIALEIGEAVADAGVLFVLNDRTAVARLVPRAGVHLGQEDLPATDARRILGPGPLLGISAHSLDQAKMAEEDGADYVGVGPTFQTTTKETGYSPRGPDLAALVAAGIGIPAFAIGGVSLESLPGLIKRGVRRVAVSSAICGAEDPRGVARSMKEMLT